MGLCPNQSIIALQICRSHGAFKEYFISIAQVERFWLNECQVSISTPHINFKKQIHLIFAEGYLMSEKLIIRNFGPLKETNIKLRDLTVFVGPQATGKSLAAQSLYCLRRYEHY